MNLEQYFSYLKNEAAKEDKPYWIDLAHQSLQKGWYREILGRHSEDIYLVRFWLSEPKANTKGSYSSRNSLLLHHFLKPDDDAHLHNHPWTGISTILSGGYVEETLAGVQEMKALQSNSITADKYHRIKSLEDNTWSLVHTGDKEGEWGFLVDGEHIHYMEYLDDEAPSEVTV
ncbi:MAG: hypothetical protein NE330_05985 [Lentisphaeraceae bacterium]|nr:hypothetical protein [Lentisphaeraceae bacterium]